MLFHFLRYWVPHIFFLGLILFTLSCQEKMICPAYQSYYIHNEKVRDLFFSYFPEDTTSINERYVKNIKKDPYGIIAPVGYRQRLDQTQAVAMKHVYLDPARDSLSTDSQKDSLTWEWNEDLDFSDYFKFFSSIDTAKDYYNVEEKSYYYYLRKELDPRLKKKREKTEGRTCCR